MTANSHQVGGTHYASTYQHWDWVEDIQLSYLEGCASKYITRSRKKNGPQDLQKALHYIDKIAERHKENLRPTTGRDLELTERFCRLNELSEDEIHAIFVLTFWRTQEDLQKARQAVQDILNKANRQ